MTHKKKNKEEAKLDVKKTETDKDVTITFSPVTGMDKLLIEALQRKLKALNFDIKSEGNSFSYKKKEEAKK